MKTSAARKKVQEPTLQKFYERSGVGFQVPGADDIVISSDIDPMPHQIGELNNALVNVSWGFFDEPGTGKTFPAQAYSIYWALNGNKVLVVMPPILLPQFKRSLLDTFIGVGERLTCHVLNQPPYPARLLKQRLQKIRAAVHKEEDPGVPAKLALRIYDDLNLKQVEFTADEVDEIRATKGRVSATAAAEKYSCSERAISMLRSTTCREDLFEQWSKDGSWPDILLMSYQMFSKVDQQVSPHYRVMVADEVHNYLCHPSSATWKKVKRFLEQDNRGTAFLPMTGTPIPNVPTDVYGIIKLLNPSAYLSLKSFERLHVQTVRQKDKEGREWNLVTGYRNLDYLRTKLFSSASRVTKEEVFSLERPMVHEIGIELSAEHLALYRKLVRERVLEVNGQTISAVQAQSLRQKALQIATHPDPFSDHPVKENNIRLMLAELLEEVGCQHAEKVVVFAIYNNTIEAMAKWFSHLNPALVYGGSNSQKNVQKFLTDDSCRLMIAHYRSGGVGLNLQSVCRYVICAEPTSVPGEFLQATERVYRKGQEKVVTFYILKALKTIWPKVVDSMRGKMKLTLKVTYDKSELLAELLGD